MSNIKVSIICLVYNHEPYLRQCLDGFVMQKTNFEYEVLIHDDASTDKSADIIREYEAKYPDIIKPVYQTENQYSKKVRMISVYLLPNAKGKYIAFCEGDDYWCDENKLQMQFDYMEEHPEVSLCGNKVRVFDNNTGKTLYHIPDRPVTEPISLSQYLMFLKNGMTIHWCSTFIKAQNYREYSENPPEFSKNLNFADIPIFLYMLTKGNLYCIDKVMGCYRRGNDGSWSSVNLTPKTMIKTVISLYNMYKKFDSYTNYKYTKDIEFALRKNANRLYHYQKLYGKTTMELPDDYLKYVTFTDKVKLSLHACASKTKRKIKKILRR